MIGAAAPAWTAKAGMAPRDITAKTVAANSGRIRTRLICALRSRSGRSKHNDEGVRTLGLKTDPAAYKRQTAAAHLGRFSRMGGDTGIVVRSLFLIAGWAGHV